jgi:hypothetical protein
MMNPLYARKAASEQSDGRVGDWRCFLARLQ